HDEDRAPVRKLFAGAFPGVVVGYFTAHGGLAAYGHVAVGALIGIGAIYALDTLLRPPPATLTAAFGAAALNLFYWYALPTLVSSPWVVWPLRAALASLTAVWLVRTARKERVLGAELAPEPAIRADAAGVAAAGAGTDLPEV